MKIEWTPRNTVAVVLTLLTAAAYALAAFDVIHLDFISNGKIEAYAAGLFVGLVMPGSPVGRVLDSIFPPKGQPAQPLTAADVAAAVAEVQAGTSSILPPPPPAPRPERIRRDGSANLDALGALLVLAGILLAWARHFLPLALLALALGAATQGCGASALSQHGSGVAITMLAVRGAADAADAERLATERACQTEACIAAAVEARRPVVAAIDVTRTAVLAWRDAVEVALEADASSPDVLSALLYAAARVLARWTDLVAALHTVGVELPALPASVAAIAGGA